MACSDLLSLSTLGSHLSIQGVEVELDCPTSGVDCEVGVFTYQGDLWHDPNVLYPNCTDGVCTEFFVCINNGCPEGRYLFGFKRSNIFTIS
jgi:hypothetical protein